ncbi:alpha/beta hydrolase [Candidatus Gracilibacteria bacterium]|nr:alpha/beta hydrolase [Candidatus Gracilibacteria bacterium]
MTVASETEDLDAIIKYAERLGYSDISLLGESMGGTIIMNSYTQSITSIIFWYSAFDFSDTDFKDFLTPEKQQELQENGHLMCAGFKVGEEFIKQIPKINIYENLKNITCPTLLLHGDQNKDVPFEQSQKSYNLLNTKKEIHILPGAGHCFRNEQEKAISLTVKFLKKCF